MLCCSKCSIKGGKDVKNGELQCKQQSSRLGINCLSSCSAESDLSPEPIGPLVFKPPLKQYIGSGCTWLEINRKWAGICDTNNICSVISHLLFPCPGKPLSCLSYQVRSTIQAYTRTNSALAKNPQPLQSSPLLSVRNSHLINGCNSAKLFQMIFLPLIFYHCYQCSELLCSSACTAHT